MKKIPFLDVAGAYDELSEALDQAHHRVMKSGWFILGPEIRRHLPPRASTTQWSFPEIRNNSSFLADSMV